MDTLAKAECIVCLATVVLIGYLLVVALVHDDWEDIKQLFHRPHKSKVEIEEKEKEKMNKMPELKAGDVICTDISGIWYLCVDPAQLYALRRDDDRGEVGLMYHTTIAKLSFSIARVYRREGYFDVGGVKGLYGLLSDPNSAQNLSALIWSSKPAVKEMTVDQISKALEYPVKVVGNDK